MPSRKFGENEHKDIAHPINAEARAQVQEAIMNAYQKEVNAQA